MRLNQRVFMRSFSPIDQRKLIRVSQRSSLYIKTQVQGWQPTGSSSSSEIFWWLKAITDAKRHSRSHSVLSNRAKTHSSQRWQDGGAEVVSGQKYPWQEKQSDWNKTPFYVQMCKFQMMWLDCPMLYTYKWHSLFLHIELQMTMQIIHMHT